MLIVEFLTDQPQDGCLVLGLHAVQPRLQESTVQQVPRHHRKDQRHRGRALRYRIPTDCRSSGHIRPALLPRSKSAQPAHYRTAPKPPVPYGNLCSSPRRSGVPAQPVGTLHGRRWSSYRRSQGIALMPTSFNLEMCL